MAAILYETVIPPEERRQLGEYYTPDWLALAALGITNSQSRPWTPPPPRLRSTISVKPLTPVSHTQALDYLLGIRNT